MGKPEILGLIPAQPGWRHVSVFLEDVPDGGDPLDWLKGPTHTVAWVLSDHGTFPVGPGDSINPAELEHLWSDTAVIDPEGAITSSYGVTFGSLREWADDALGRRRSTQRAITNSAI